MYLHCRRILLYRYFCRVYSSTWPMLPATFSLCHVFVCLSWHQLQHEKPGFCPADTPSAIAAITATATATAATAALEMGPEYVLVQPFCDAYRWGVAVSVTMSSPRRVFFRFATFFVNFSSSSLCTPIVGMVLGTCINEIHHTLFRRRNDEWC